MNNYLSRLKPKALAIVREIGCLAKKQRMTAYLVGGPVRDLMLGVAAIDLDIVVEGNGIRLAQVWAKQHPGAQLTRYPAFKTATVSLADGVVVDFATARKESYAHPGAYPAVEPSSINEDLFRRDFTVNAMAIAIGPEHWGKLVDPFGGRLDLLKKRLRVLHAKSFEDDATRILRAARFKARFNFHLEAKTLQWLNAAVKIKVLDTIKPQRYLKDFNKILKEVHSTEAVECLKQWEAYKSF